MKAETIVKAMFITFILSCLFFVGISVVADWDTIESYFGFGK